MIKKLIILFTLCCFPGLCSNAQTLPNDLQYYKINCAINDKVYASYHQILRESIKTRLIKNYNYSQNYGDVYIYFIVKRNGSLNRILVDTDKSTKNMKLINTTIRSVQDASPFHKFPKYMDFDELVFSIHITFRQED